MRLKNIKSSDNSGTDTAEGPNGATATVDRHAPPLHLETPLNLPLHHTGDTHCHCTFHLHFGSSSVIRFNEVPSMLTSLLSRNKIREHVDCLAPIVLTVAKQLQFIDESQKRKLSPTSSGKLLKLRSLRVPDRCMTWKHLSVTIHRQHFHDCEAGEATVESRRVCPRKTAQAEKAILCRYVRKLET